MTLGNVRPYCVLLEAFVLGRLDSQEFQILFLFMFKNGPKLDQSAFEILNALFYEVEDFEVPFPGDVEMLTTSGLELRKAAATTRDQLCNR
jgi:hypothetical protein